MYILVLNSQIADNTIIEAIRTIDAVHEGRLYAISQLESNAVLVGIEARNCFYEGISASKLKYIIKINHHRKRNININRGLVKDKCLRYTEKED